MPIIVLKRYFSEELPLEKYSCFLVCLTYEIILCLFYKYFITFHQSYLSQTKQKFEIMFFLNNKRLNMI